MTRHVAIGVEFATAVDSLPDAPTVQRWAHAALDAEGAVGEVAIRIMDEAEMTQLNEQYRGKHGATNVLSFPAGTSNAGVELLGDIAICAPVLQREAHTQSKSLEAHFAHLVIHGVLHLLGYDHETEDEARTMEGKEAAILAELGIDDPYAGEARGAERSRHG